MLCYNCYFLYVGDVFDKKQIEGIQEDKHIPTTQQVDWEMDDNMLEHFRELGLVEEDPDDDYIVRL